MKTVEDQKPKIKLMEKSEKAYDSGWGTYNESGITYNEAGETYGGIYGTDGNKAKFGDRR